MAEMDSILGFVENKNVLVTGATGFLAKSKVVFILIVSRSDLDLIAG